MYSSTVCVATNLQQTLQMQNTYEGDYDTVIDFSLRQTAVIEPRTKRRL